MVRRTLIRPRRRRLASTVRAFVLPLLAGLALVATVATSVSATGSFSATANVSASIQYVNDHAGTVFTFTVKNTGTTPIGAVEIARPSPSWAITSCPDAPTGWSVGGFPFKCRYTSPAGPARDLLPGHTSNHFQLRATVRASINDLEARWTVVVSRTSSFGVAANLRTATTFPRGLTTTARSLQILDALVLDAPATVGAPCPVATSANHSSVAGSTGHTVAICGRNRSNVVLTPLATSFLGGTLIASHGGFTSGPIGARTAGSVVLGNWANVTITPDAGSDKTIIGRLVAAGLRHTSHLVTLAGYTALNTPPIAELESASTNEDTASSPITLRATDANGHAMTFGIVTGPAHGTLDPIVAAACPATPGAPKTCTATVVYHPAANYNGSDIFTYQATDSLGASSVPVFVTITIAAVNDAPVVVAHAFSLAENSANGTPVGTATYSDPDTGQTHVFSITAGNTGGAFAINSSSGAITVANSAALDYETNPSFSLSVRVTDNGAPVLFGSATITVNLTNVNEVPVVAAHTYSVPENSANGTAVGSATYSDPDAGQTHVFSITAGNTGGAFAINSSTGAITVANSAALNYETNPSFSLTVQVTDNGSPVQSGSGTITVNLTDLNEAPVVTPATFSLPENSANATPVGTVLYADPDAGQTHVFSITAGNTGGAFGINSSTGAITVANSAVLNYETTPSFSLTVRVTDNGAGPLFGSATITVNLTNVNEKPVITAPASVSGHLSVDVKIEGISLADPDAGADDLSLVLAVGGGKLTVRTDVSGGVTTAVGNGTSSVTIVGSLAKINATLGATNGLLYNSNGFVATSTTLTLNADDLGHTGSGGSQTDSASITINLNSPPVVTTSAGHLAVTEGDPATAIDPAVTVTDADDTNLESGRVRISVGFQPGDDLQFTNTVAITGSYDSGTGVLTLTGTDTVANYQAALQSVKFASTNDNPGGIPKTVEFKVNDGDVDSNLATKIIDVTAVNDAPTVTTTSANLAYTEGDGAVAVDSGVTVTDPDSAEFTSATVTITTGCVSGEDVLALVSPPAGITVDAYDSALCRLTLHGSATTSVANFQAALPSVTYSNSSQNPSGSRTVSVQVKDDFGVSSNVATRTIDLIAVNDPPVVTTSAGSLAYTENDAATAIDSAIAVTDPDSATLVGATVQISTGCITGEDILALASPPAGITVAPYVLGTCTLTLSGAKAPTVYQTALRGVTYFNSSDNPSTAARTVSFTVNDGALDSNSATRGIKVTAVNDPPTTSDASHAVTGNIGISVGAGSGVLNGVTDPEGNTFTASIDASNASLGTAVINANGSYTFNPRAGRQGLDTVKFKVCDNGAPVECSVGNLNLTVTGMIWFVDNSAGSPGNGQIATPFDTLAALQTINDGVDTATTFHPASGDTIFLYRDVATDYAGGLTLLDNQKVIGAGATASIATISGITLAPDSVPSTLPATGGVRPNIAGGLVLGSGNTLRGLALGDTIGGTALSGASFGTLTLASGLNADVLINTDGRAINLANGTISGDFISMDSAGGVNNVLLTNVGTVGSGTNFGGGALSGASADSVVISNGGGAFVIGSDITATAGKSVDVNGKSGGSVVFSGHVVDNGHGVSLTSNGTAIIKFLGDLDVSSGTHAGFTATGGGTVAVTGAGNTIATTTGTALNVANTTIGSDGLTFHSVSANGGTSGIVLNNTGVLGGLTITGDGTNNSSGGTIQSITGTGVALTTTRDLSLSSMNIHDTGDSGISGTGVTNFSFVNGTINNSGNAGFESNIAFNSSPTTANNIDGTLTVTGSTLTNAWYSGLDVQSGAGTISNANVSNNTITSSTLVSNSQGFGISFVGLGTTSTVFSLTKATIDNNTIANFPSAAGIQVSVTNSTATGTGPSAGTPGTANVVEINGNTIHGATALNRMGTQAIAVVATGGNSGSRAKANFTASNNTINDVSGTVILVGNNTYADMTGTINGNTIVANHQADFISGNGIGGGNGLSGGTNAATPNINLTVTNNTISATDGNGILLVGRGTSGSAAFKIQNNTVGAPVASIARQGIRVDAGNGGSADDSICLNISGNTSAGSGGTTGIGLRKQGTVATTNDFGINGLSPDPATGAQASSYVAGLNPASGGVTIVSGDNFVACTLP